MVVDECRSGDRQQEEGMFISKWKRRGTPEVAVLDLSHGNVFADGCCCLTTVVIQPFLFVEIAAGGVVQFYEGYFGKLRGVAVDEEEVAKDVTWRKAEEELRHGGPGASIVIRSMVVSYSGTSIFIWFSICYLDIWYYILRFYLQKKF